MLAAPKPSRDQHTRMRTRVVAKAKMLGTIDDELKSFLGSDTTRRGVTRIFNMFQHPTLNRRLVYVILEGMLVTLFSDNKFRDVFQQLHSRSPRVEQLKAKRSADAKATSSSSAAAAQKMTSSSSSSSLSFARTQSVRYRKS